jgi:hypothetical protein
MTLPESVLLVERPGQFRDALLKELTARGLDAAVRDDALEALASLERLSPQIVVISEEPGPPGALGLCRMLRRKWASAVLYRLGEPSPGDQLDQHSRLLPRAAGAAALAQAIVDRDKSPLGAQRVWQGTVASLELGPLLLAIETRWLTGRLILTRPGTEREIAFVRGMPIHARSSVLGERLGAVGARRGLVTEQQVAEALDLAQGRGLRLGAALIELGALDAAQLMQLLALQLLEQLTAACNSGAAEARFVLDPQVALRHPLLRMSAFTVLVHAAAATPLEDIEQVLRELAEHTLTVELPTTAEAWLADLAPDSALLLRLTSDLDSVRELRARLRQLFPVDPETELALHPDVLTLALLRSGVFRLNRPGDAPRSEPRAGLRSLSPPSIVHAVTHGSHGEFASWPVSTLEPARGPFEQAIDEFLHGARDPSQARALITYGPLAECDPAARDVYALALCGQHPLHGLFLPNHTARLPTLSELRLGCHALLKRLDALDAEHTGIGARVHLRQVRAQAERVFGLLPASETLPPPRPSQLAPRTAAGPAPPSQAANDALLQDAEPLVRERRFRELQQLLASPGAGVAALDPAKALLYAIAAAETAEHDEAREAAAPEAIAAGALHKAVGLPSESAALRLMAERLVGARRAAAKPRLGLGISLALGVLLGGGAVGFLLHSQLLGLFGN